MKYIAKNKKIIDYKKCADVDILLHVYLILHY